MILFRSHIRIHCMKTHNFLLISRRCYISIAYDYTARWQIWLLENQIFTKPYEIVKFHKKVKSETFSFSVIPYSTCSCRHYPDILTRSCPVSLLVSTDGSTQSSFSTFHSLNLYSAVYFRISSKIYSPKCYNLTVIPLKLFLMIILWHLWQICHFKNQFLTKPY